MTFPWKCFFPLLSKFFTPFAQSTIRNTKISCDVCFAFSTGLKQLDCLLLKFFCVGRLRFVHRTLLFLFYQISLFRPPKSGQRPGGPPNHFVLPTFLSHTSNPY